MDINLKNWQNLLKYYVAALVREREKSITFYPSQQGKSIFSILNEEILFSSQTDQIILKNNSALKEFFEFTQKNSLLGTGSFYYGYPLVRSYVALDTPTPFESLTPLLYARITIKFPNPGEMLISIEESIPNVNENVFRKANLDPSEIYSVSEEIVDCITQYQLADSYSEGITEAVRKYTEISKMQHFSAIDAKLLNHQRPAREDREAYIINDAIIYYSAASEERTYTAALVKELELLQRDQYFGMVQNTALYPLLTQKNSNNHTQNDPKILLAYDINKSQSDAIIAALQSDTTVVGGPPGTGKSQVVLNLVSSLIYNNMSGILISKNNTAVNIISNQFSKTFPSNPVLLRVGNKEYRNDAIKTLKALSESLSGNNFDQSKHEKIKKTYDKYYTDVWQRDQRQLEKLNLADKWAVRTSEYEESIKNIKTKDKKWIEQNSFSVSDSKGLRYEVKETELWALELKKTEDSGFFSKMFRKVGAWLSGRTLSDFWPKMTSLQTRLAYSMQNDDKKVHNAIEYLRHVQSLLNLAEAFNENKRMQEELAKLPNDEELLQNYEDNQNKMIEFGKELLTNTLNKRYQDFSKTEGTKRQLDDFINIHEQLSSGGSKTKAAYSSLYKASADIFPRIRAIVPCWASSSLSAQMFPLQAGIFDLLIVDEASQCDIASIIPFLYRAKKAIIIGDKNQLRHIVNFNDTTDLSLARNAGLDDMNSIIFSYKRSSIYDLAVRAIGGNDSIIQLDEHYRSHPDIINFSNQKYYASYLKIYTKVGGIKIAQGEKGIEWVDIQGEVKRPAKGSALNTIEAQKVYEVTLETLRKYRERDVPVSIGIVSPLRAHVEELKDIFSKRLKELTEEEREYILNCLKGDNPLIDNGESMIDTVHRFQGNERDIIIFSPVASNGMENYTYNFINDRAQLNVAITRARSKLIIVGDKEFCRSRGDELGDLVAYVEGLSEPKYRQEQEIIKIESPIEKILYDSLIKNDLKPIAQYDDLGFRLDFAILSGGLKIGIECMGTQFHMNSAGSMLKTDKIRLRKLTDAGWKMFVFWSWEIKNNVQECVSKVTDFIEKSRSEQIIKSDNADDPYLQVLNLSKMFSVSELESKYNELAEKLNPDKFVGLPENVVDAVTQQREKAEEAYRYFYKKYQIGS